MPAARAWARAGRRTLATQRPPHETREATLRSHVLANFVFSNADVAEVMLGVAREAFAAEALIEAGKEVNYHRERIRQLEDHPLTTTADLDDSFAFTEGSISDRYEASEYWMLIDCLRECEARLLRFVARAGKLTKAFRSAAHDWMRRYHHEAIHLPFETYAAHMTKTIDRIHRAMASDDDASDASVDNPAPLRGALLEVPCASGRTRSIFPTEFLFRTSERDSHQLPFGSSILITEWHDAESMLCQAVPADVEGAYNLLLARCECCGAPHTAKSKTAACVLFSHDCEYQDGGRGAAALMFHPYAGCYELPVGEDDLDQRRSPWGIELPFTSRRHLARLKVYAWPLDDAPPAVVEWNRQLEQADDRDAASLRTQHFAGKVGVVKHSVGLFVAPPAVVRDPETEPQLGSARRPRWVVGAVVVMDDDGPSRKSSINAHVTNLLWYMATDRPVQFRRALLNLVRRRVDAELDFPISDVPAVRGDCTTREEFAAYDYLASHAMRNELVASMVLPLYPLRYTSEIASPSRDGGTLDVATDGSYGALFGVAPDEMASCLERGVELRAAAKAKRIADAERFRCLEHNRRLKMLGRIAGHQWEAAWDRAYVAVTMVPKGGDPRAQRIAEMADELLGMWAEPGCTRPTPGEIVTTKCTSVERAVLLERIHQAQSRESAWRERTSLADADNGYTTDKRMAAFSLRSRAVKAAGDEPEWILSAYPVIDTSVPRGFSMARQLNRALVVLAPFGYPHEPQLEHSVKNGIVQGPLHPRARALVLDIVRDHLQHTSLWYDHVSAQRTASDRPQVVRFPTGAVPYPRIEVDSPDAQLSVWLQLLTRGCAPYTAHGEALRFGVDRAYVGSSKPVGLRCLLLRMAIGERVCITFGIDWGVFEVFARRLLDPVAGGPSIGYDETCWMDVADQNAPDLRTIQLTADRVCSALNRKLRRCDAAAKDAALPLVAFRAALLLTWRCTSDRHDRTAKKSSISTARKGYSMLARRHNVQLRDATAEEAAEVRRTRGIRPYEAVCVRIDPPRLSISAYDPDVTAFCEGWGWKRCQCSRGCVFRRGPGALVGRGQLSMRSFLQ